MIARGKRQDSVEVFALDPVLVLAGGVAKALNGRAALPDDLPPAKGLADGTTAKGADGKVVAIVKSGAWATP